MGQVDDETLTTELLQVLQPVEQGKVNIRAKDR
jgi:hypothetical protein